MSYTLANVDDRAKANPTFDIPSRKLREGLSPGNVAKLIFLPSDDSYTGERMWVEIASVTPRQRYVGKLCNRPVVVQDLRFGEMIEFGPEHVADWEAGR